MGKVFLWGFGLVAGAITLGNLAAALRVTAAPAATMAAYARCPQVVTGQRQAQTRDVENRIDAKIAAAQARPGYVAGDPSTWGPIG